MADDPLTHDAAMYFRDQLREARALALRDAEAFDELLFTVERLGSALTNTTNTLGHSTYQKAIAKIAQRSSLADEIPGQWRECYIPFQVLYESVRDARNDALHQGALARHLTIHATQLAIVLEDALVQDSTTVGDYMVQNPVRAALWQPVGFIRQAMLSAGLAQLV